jgi:hypothetical protein
MTEDNNTLQCYVKSFGHDGEELVRSTFSLLKVAAIPLVIIFLISLLGYALVTNLALFTQYATYLILFALIDGLFLFLLYDPMGEFTNLGNIGFPVLAVIIYTLFIWAMNACFIISLSYTVMTQNWSFMNVETAVNIIVMVIGIMAVRAYVRCTPRTVIKTE